MKDHLLDLVGHTHDLGCIDMIKITGTSNNTAIAGLDSANQTVVIDAEFHDPVPEFIGTFGMPNLAKLKVLLALQEYRENAQITVKQQDRDGVMEPVGLHFENASGDFHNDYRFMTAAIVSEKLKTPKFKGVTWAIEFEPTVASIMRLKMQAQANAEEPVFQVKTDKTDLKFVFGDHSTHAGEFVFHSAITGSLKHAWAWPVKTVISILDLTGDKVVRISDEGAMQITVDSGIARYDYILPAQKK